MNLDPKRRCFLLLFLWVFFYIISGALVGFILAKNPESVRAMRVCAVLQDLLAFILPSVLCAMLVTRLPATFLGVDRKPAAMPALTSIMTLLVSVPVMNWIIRLNQSVTFPEKWSAIEKALRNAESVAQGSINAMLGGDGIGDLVMGLLIVGLLAGLSEELFFRGTVQRVFMSCRMNAHMAIWLTAVIFSAIHFQFFGFVPRILLGAFFGYIFYWTGSLWVSVTAHAVNNILYVVSRWMALRNGVDVETATNPQLIPVAIIISAVMVVVGLYLVYRGGRGNICKPVLKHER